MEFATGAMSSLLRKLGELLLEEYNMQKRLKKGIKDLMDELLVIQAALVKVSDVPLDQLDPLVQIWANDARELSYAIEDNLDSFMVRVDDHEPDKPHTFLGFVKKTCKKVNKLKIRRDIANDIKDVKIQVKEVKERYDRYKDVTCNIIAKTEVDPRVLTLYNNVSNLVGIDELVDELTNSLSKSDDVSQQKLKTLSIVGFGGLGKTTLAKSVYDNLKKTFDCAGFVPVGRNPDKKKILRDILHELDKKKYKGITESNMDEKQLIDELRELLTDKRYLIVIDDLWDVSTWEFIKCALVDGSSGNRIITTTRIHEVAKTIGGAYTMKPLSDDNSKKLFHIRIHQGEGITPDGHLDKLSDKISRKCGGVPLSIITLASLLVSKPRDNWNKVFESIGFGHEDTKAVENTRKILSYSYYDLPFHLKTCLLHLSIYPEDKWIDKKSVIWKWVAEGFIPIKEGMSAFELGESYYNDLLNRSMTQVRNVNNAATMEFCCVHDLVLDLIRSLSGKVNFVTILDRMQNNTCSPSTSSTARRIAIHDGAIEHMDMGHVRSFNVISFVDYVLPPLSRFKVLRVLSLENCMFPTGGCRFEQLGKLVQLRYLGLKFTPVCELPIDIGHDLKFLQTLDVTGSGIKELPQSVGELTKLMCLIASRGTTMMANIEKLTSIEVLELHHVDKSPDFTSDLGKLTQLRVLQIYFDKIDEIMHKALVNSMHSLPKIKVVIILSVSGELQVDDEWEEWEPPSELSRFCLTGVMLPRRPLWMDSSSVPRLSHVFLSLHVLEAVDMHILGRMSPLRFLFLLCADSAVSYTFGSHEFPNLTYLVINAKIVCEEGALPMLTELQHCASMGKDISLVGNMPSLQKITYFLDCEGRGREEVETAEAAFRQAAEAHPNRPNLTIDRRSYEPDEKEMEEEAFRDMLVELGRTMVVLTVRQSNVRAEDIQGYFSSIISNVLNSPVIPDLLFKCSRKPGSQSGLEDTLDFWRYVAKDSPELFATVMLNEAGKWDSFIDNWSEMMQKMMPVISQVLAELAPFESTLQPQHNDRGKLGGRRGGSDTTITKNDKASPTLLP